MRFLVDQAVSWQVARDLRAAGHDAVHVRDVGLAPATDDAILDLADREGRAVITQDTDFGTLLATSDRPRSPVILLRLRDGRPATHSRVLLRSVPALENELGPGVVAVLEEATIRVRRLWATDAD